MDKLKQTKEEIKNAIKSQNPHLNDDELESAYELIHGDGKVTPYHEALPKEYH